MTRYVEHKGKWVPEYTTKSRGLGDFVARAAYRVGFKQSNCKCAKRQETLNRWIPRGRLYVPRGYPLPPIRGAATCTRTAISASAANVQSAIDAASSGEVVCVPAGSATWGAVTLSGKQLSLQGNGIGSTVITNGSIDVTASAANFIDVSGFTFNDTVFSVGGIEADIAFRWHHNRHITTSGISHVWEVTAVYGLFDNNIVDKTATGGQVLSVYGSNVGSDQGFTPWMRPLSLGTQNAVYMEDNVITYPAGAAFVEDALDCYAGARFVFRHNIVNNDSIGWHGTDTGGWRSPVSFEVYNNTWVNGSSGALRGATIRGGSGVIYNNVYSGAQSWSGYQLALYRAASTQTGEWLACNGGQYGIGTPGTAAAIVGGSFTSDEAHRCSTDLAARPVKWCSGNRDKPCTSDSHCTGFGTCSTFFDGSVNAGYPCRDQPGVAPMGQTVFGVWAWNNGGQSISINDLDDLWPDGGRDNYLLSGRDFTNGSTSQPGGLTYTPLVYPHPLQGIAIVAGPKVVGFTRRGGLANV